MISLVLVDGDDLVRAGIRALLERECWLRVVDDTDDPLEAVAVVERTDPDLLLAELCFNGVHRVTDLCRICGPDRLLVVTRHANLEVVSETLRHGVHGYVLKRSPPDQLLTAIKHVGRGTVYVDPALGAALANDLGAALTGRERRVVALVAAGNTSLEIADQLHVSRRTVESTRAAIRAKLHIYTNAELCAYARRMGLVGEHESCLAYDSH
jgi:DNA-binding NarL/FixJ family response regulator